MGVILMTLLTFDKNSLQEFDFEKVITTQTQTLHNPKNVFQLDDSIVSKCLFIANTFLEPTKLIHNTSNAYTCAMKHAFERITSEYLSYGDANGILFLAGFGINKSKVYTSIENESFYYFNISERSAKFLVDFSYLYERWLMGKFDSDLFTLTDQWIEFELGFHYSVLTKKQREIVQSIFLTIPNEMITDEQIRMRNRPPIKPESTISRN